MANNIKRTKKDLASARKGARRMAQGQLNAIQANIPTKRFDAKAAKLVNNMQRYQAGMEKFGARQGAAIQRDTQAIARGGSSTGAKNSTKDAMLTTARRRSAERDAKYGETVATAQARMGQGVAAAGGKALGQLQRTDARGAKSANTILDVLGAERKMVDQRFLAELREKKLDRQFQMKMQDRAAELQKDLAEFENELPLDTATRQQMRLEYKYAKKQAMAEGAGLGGTDPAMLGAISTGQEIAAAASNAYSSEWANKASEAAFNNQGDDVKYTGPADAMRDVISQRVSQLAGDSLSQEAVDRIVYDVVRNQGETSSDYVVGTVTSSNPEWAAQAGAVSQQLDQWATESHGITTANPENMARGPAQRDPENVSDRTTRLLGGDTRNPREVQERERMMFRLGYDLSPLP